MPQTHKVSRNNTRIVRHPDGSLKRVTLHNTIVFEQSPLRDDGTRVLAISNGGWNTVTTQTRINQCMSECGYRARYSRAKGKAMLGPYEMPPYGRCLLLTVSPSMLVNEWILELCPDAFVVVN